MEDYKKKYEQALGRANSKIETYNHLGNASAVKSICEIFPELKESEDDRIRRDIIRYLKKTSPAIGENIEKMLDWLEKQGKKSHCNGEVNDETLQKQLQIWFDKGKCSGRDDVIFHPENFGLQKQCEQRIISKTEPIVEGLTTEFEKQVSHLIASAINKEHEYNQSYVKWTANALLNYAKHELEKQGEQSKQHLYDIIIALWDLLDKIDTFSDLQIDDTNPDNPFRKIEHITQERHKFVKSDGYNLYIQGEQITDFKQSKQKPAWSEEDEDNYVTALWHIKRSSGREGSVYNWLKSIKDRMKGE